MSRKITSLAALALACSLGSPAQNALELNRSGKETFLKKARIVRASQPNRGITGTTRATLSDGRTKHDASIQTIDEHKLEYRTAAGTELNFRDTYRFNIAAYKLDRLLGLNMVPVTVERSYKGKSGSYTWWVDEVLMLEFDRLKKKISPPDPDVWNGQMHVVRVFDQLIYNTDRNLGNLVIDKDWRVWMIDHSRAFRTMTDLREPENLALCDRGLLAKMKELKLDALKEELGTYLGQMEIRAILARRDKIVRLFDEKGPTALYDRPLRPE
jgi:hypothetical protein